MVGPTPNTVRQWAEYSLGLRDGQSGKKTPRHVNEFYLRGYAKGRGLWVRATGPKRKR